MTTYEIKDLLCTYLSWKRGCVYVATELSVCFNSYADVAGLTEDGKLIELEIKTSEFDLNNELNIIKNVNPKSEDPKNYKKGILFSDSAKKKKHTILLNQNPDSFFELKEFHGLLIPHKYYMCVTKDLIAQTKEVIKKSLPYGIILLDDKVHKIKVIKQAKWIHFNAIEKEQYIRLIKRASSENKALRERLMRPAKDITLEICREVEASITNKIKNL